MSCKSVHSFKLVLVLLLVCQVGHLQLVRANQKEKPAGKTEAPDKNGCATSERKGFDVKCKERYFLGESPGITISITNTSRATQNVKQADYQKFSFETTGVFQNDGGEHKKTAVYDGSWDIPNPSAKTAQPGEFQVWQSPRKREPRFVKLEPGETTSLDLDLSRVFTSQLGVGKYRLMVKSEGGQNVVKEFEVYFDEAKSVPILAKMLSDENERNWAAFNLARFNRPKLIALLNELLKSADERQRTFASGLLAKTEVGWFDYLKLKVEIKERYSSKEKPVLAISIVNNSSAVQTVTEAEFQKFSVELTRMSGGQSRPETKMCAYDGSQGSQSNVRAQAVSRKPKTVKLAELEATTLSLDLSQCLQSTLSVGKYQLTVKSADAEQGFKDQKVVKTFEIYSDDAKKSVRALGQ